MNISFYKNAKDNIGVVVGYQAILKGIEKGKWVKEVMEIRFAKKKGNKEELETLKKMLPGATFSGQFNARQADQLLIYSNIITLDVDGLNADFLEEIKEKLKANEYVHCVFTSPSGAGLKIMIRVDSGPENHADAFRRLEEDFKKNADITLDPSGKDINRLCFVSYDPEIYFNENSKAFHVEPYPVEVKKEAERPINATDEIITDPLHILAISIKMVNKTKKYEEGQRNAYIHSLTCLLNEHGVERDVAYDIITDRFNLPNTEVKEIVEKTYRSKIDLYASRPLVKYSEIYTIESTKRAFHSLSEIDQMEFMSFMLQEVKNFLPIKKCS